jgi:hypothetical protein
MSTQVDRDIEAPFNKGYPVASWPLRLPIIRHIRAMWFCYRCNRHYAFYQSIGMLGGWSEDEIGYWQAIKRGEA